MCSSDLGVPDEAMDAKIPKGGLVSEPAVKLAKHSPFWTGPSRQKTVMERAEKEFNTWLQQHTPLVALICFFSWMPFLWLRESVRISEQKSSPALGMPA